MKNENLRNRFEDFLKFYENFIKKNDAFWGVKSPKIERAEILCA